MSTFIIFSFILHFISLFAIVVLYLRQNRYVESEKEMKKMKTELEEVLQGYLLEMQEENKLMLVNMKSINKQSVKLAKSEQKMEKKNSVATSEQEAISINNITKVAASQASDSALKNNQKSKEYIPPFEDVKDKIEVSIATNEKKSVSQKEKIKEDEKTPFATIIDEQVKVNEMAQKLAKEGYSIEEIAKKLHKGKTEVELMLKFYSEIT